MVEEQRIRLEKAISNLIEEVYRSHFKKLQVGSFILFFSVPKYDFLIFHNLAGYAFVCSKLLFRSTR